MDPSHYALVILFICIAVFRGFFSTDFLISVFISAFHVPLTIEALNALSPALRLSDTAATAAVWGPISFMAAFSATGIARETLFKTRGLAQRSVSERRLNYVLLVLGVLVLTISLNRMVVTLQTGYSNSLGIYLIHPTVDWFLLGAYLVVVSMKLGIVSEAKNLSIRSVFLLMPLFPMLVTGSRQAFLGPVVAFFVVYYTQQSSASREALLRHLFFLLILFIAVLGIFELVRNVRTSETQNVQWLQVSGIAGILIETGRSATLIDWALQSCAGLVSPTAYFVEAIARLIPAHPSSFVNFSIAVGGNNAFSVVAEGVCVAGPDGYAYWTAWIGVVLGAIFSGNFLKRRSSSFRQRAFIFLSIGVVWPRDELVGYSREIFWIALLLPFITVNLLRRSGRSR